ncbi:uncharacterized protein K460DRAFT_366768 [Cucurbitaria berberidis CBS 394.84]|uniref:BTB domain-containing protein n=1 Tax=Cucurbitaria berberidis CBS 394.84 TaxID=1168544 RepID=A0A9P4GIA3_9PLEO|nr:uncharacterized protein K460DRAFT_366768 [Cucurbitaria berberidis CBS 394.84]KAF1845926.1 hypothetical protein K460DRAFT_366768 [Cucurbitaria berberidis CBS 394.84]
MSTGTAQDTPASSWRSQTNLLQLVFTNDYHKFPTPHVTRSEHAQQVMKSHIGCDLLLDSNGIVFPIHSAWALCGPAADWMVLSLFLGTPSKQFTIPFPAFSPIIVDRFVNFLYLGTYQRHIEGEISNIGHAQNKPDTPYNDATQKMKSVRFHLEMIKFAEFLEYPALIDTAYVKLIEQLLMRSRFDPKAMKDFVTWTFGSAKICIDKDGLLKHLIVTAAIAHEYKRWDKRVLNAFLDLIQDNLEFLGYLNNAKEKHKKILKETLEQKQTERQNRTNKKRAKVEE